MSECTLANLEKRGKRAVAAAAEDTRASKHTISTYLYTTNPTPIPDSVSEFYFIVCVWKKQQNFEHFFIIFEAALGKPFLCVKNKHFVN